MNLQQLRYARALAECGSFVKAANRCAVTQPTLSNGIAQLEEELGQQLFARTTRMVQLTEAGEYLLADINDILNAQAALLARARNFSNPDRMLIRIGVSPVISIRFVDTVLEPFRLEHKKIEVVFRELNMAEMLGLLERGQLDLAFGPVDATHSDQPGFSSVAFLEDPLVFVACSGSKTLYHNAKSVTLQDIASETFVMVPDTCGLTQTTRALFSKSQLKLKEYSGQAHSYGVLRDWAELGIGSAILPRSKLPANRGPELPIVEGDSPLQIRYRGLWRDGPKTPSQVRQLAAFLNKVAPFIVRGLAVVE
jgi:DNA-binding transcriptional LysR family regulator